MLNWNRALVTRVHACCQEVSEYGFVYGSKL